MSYAADESWWTDESSDESVIAAMQSEIDAAKAAAIAEAKAAAAKTTVTKQVVPYVAPAKSNLVPLLAIGVVVLILLAPKKGRRR